MKFLTPKEVSDLRWQLDQAMIGTPESDTILLSLAKQSMGTLVDNVSKLHVLCNQLQGQNIELQKRLNEKPIEILKKIPIEIKKPDLEADETL